MTETIALLYFWLKSAHIIFVIFWMAGLFMLPRYFVYHQEAAPGSPEEALWVDRERKLLKIILLPSIIVVWVAGLALAMTTGAFADGWLHAKLLLVLLLIAYHGLCGRLLQRFEHGQPAHGHAWFRWFNELPVLLLLAVVLLVVLKPF